MEALTATEQRELANRMEKKTNEGIHGSVLQHRAALLRRLRQ